jgi:hypothetical protein
MRVPTPTIPGRGFDHPPSSSADVKERVRLYNLLIDQHMHNIIKYTKILQRAFFSIILLLQSLISECYSQHPFL